MNPGDIRTTETAAAIAQCYCCRKWFNLDDLKPVTSKDSADWRYICPLCAHVAKVDRPAPLLRMQINSFLENGKC